MRRSIRWVVYPVVAIALLIFVLDRIANPRDMNHIVLVNQSGSSFKKLTVCVERANKTRHIIRNGSFEFPNDVLQVVNWPKPFGVGDSVQVAEGGTTLARVQTNSIGRYGHSLIILLEPDQKVLFAYDKWPGEEGLPE